MSAKPTMKEKAVIYARVSSKEQEETGYSLPAQQKLLEDYAKRKGLEVVKIFSVAESASGTKQRKVFAEMVGYLEKQRIPHLLCEKVDRLTRNLKEAVVANDWLEANLDRHIHFVKQNLVLDHHSKSDEKFRWDIEIVLAKKYVANLSEEVRKGQAEKIAQGWLPTKPPLGYMTIGDAGHKTHIPDPTYVPHIRKMFELYAGGNYSVEHLSHIMYDAGLRTRTGSRLVRSRLADLLGDPFYIGKNRWKGKVYDGKHEPLISSDLFRRVQEVLQHKTTAKYRKHDYLLKGRVVCENCGGLLTWERQKGIVYGHCNQYRRCVTRTWYKETDFEAKLGGELDSFRLITPRLAEWVRKALKELHKGEIADRTATLKGIQSRQTRLKQQQGLLYDDRLDGRISAEAYDQKSAELNQELESLAEALKCHTEADAAYYELGSNIFELAQQAGKIFRDAPLAKKKRLLSLMYKDMRVRDGQLIAQLTDTFAALSHVVAGLNGSKVSEKRLSDFRIFELAQYGSDKGRKALSDPKSNTLLRG